MPKYGKKAQEQVEETMHKYKRGQLKSGSGDKVKSRKQAVAIGLSEAREKGAKVPPTRGKSARKRSISRGRSTTRARRTTSSRSRTSRKGSRARSSSGTSRQKG